MNVFLPIAAALEGDRVTLPDVKNVFCRARCEAIAGVGFACLPCRTRLANQGQIDAHLELSPDQVHTIARLCRDHGWEAL